MTFSVNIYNTHVILARTNCPSLFIIHIKLPVYTVSVKYDTDDAITVPLHVYTICPSVWTALTRQKKTAIFRPHTLCALLKTAAFPYTCIERRKQQLPCYVTRRNLQTHSRKLSLLRRLLPTAPESVHRKHLCLPHRRYRTA